MGIKKVYIFLFTDGTKFVHTGASLAEATRRAKSIAWRGNGIKSQTEKVAASLSWRAA